MSDAATNPMAATAPPTAAGPAASTASTTAAVVLERVSHWYGPVIGLNDVSLRFERGVTGLLGPNGAGKSTLMRLMTGQMAPSQGSVQVFGSRPFANPAVLGRLGHSPEHEQLWDHLDGAAHLFALLHYGGFSASEARTRAARALDRVRLAAAGSKKCGAYSKGMRQRLRIAQAIAHDPELIVLDEPLNGLDPVGRREVIDLVRELGAAGHTVVVSGHVLHEVEKMTRRIALVHKGRVLAEGTIEEIRRALDQRPHHVRVATDDPRGLARLLLEEPGVLSVRVDVHEARFEVTEPGPFFDRLARIAADGHLAVKEYESTDDNLQAVFDYLVA